MGVDIHLYRIGILQLTLGYDSLLWMRFSYFPGKIEFVEDQRRQRCHKGLGFTFLKREEDPDGQDPLK